MLLLLLLLHFLTIPFLFSSERFHFIGVGRVLGNRYKLGEKVLVTNGDKASGNFIKYDVEVRDADVVSFCIFVVLLYTSTCRDIFCKYTNIFNIQN